MTAIWIILAKTRFPAKLIQTSREHGLESVDFFFDLANDFLPEFLKRGGERIIRLVEAARPAAPEFGKILYQSAAMHQQVEAAQRIAAYALLISQVAALIVVAGNKDDGKGAPILSNGVEEEVKIALRLGKPVIPIGATGHVAQQVWQAAAADPESYLPGIQCDDQLQCLGSNRASVAEMIAAAAVLLERGETRAVIGFQRNAV